MSSLYDSGEALPNADVLRLREYAQILNNVSDLVEAFKTRNTKMDIDNDYIVDLEKSPRVIIPNQVLEHVGDVSFITIKLKLTADTMHKDDDIVTEANEEPTMDCFSKAPAAMSPVVLEDLIVREASTISVYLFGDKGTFSASRSNLPNDSTPKDNIFYNGENHSKPVPVEPISQKDLSILLLSIVSPDAVSQYANKPLNPTSPELFGAINELLAPATRPGISDKTHYLEGNDEFFRHRLEFDPKTQRMKTSFRIRFRSHEPDRHIIDVIHSLDTEYKLEFQSISEDVKFTSNSLEYDAPDFFPYTPSIDELKHLNNLLVSELAKVNREQLAPVISIEDLEEVAADEFDETSMETDYKFETIVVEDTRQDFVHTISKKALSIELEELIRKNAEDDTTEDDTN